MNLDDIMKTLSTLPKDIAHKELYEYVLGKKLNLDNPTDLNEKLQWLMVYKYDDNVSVFADKLAVRDYVRVCGFEDILTKIYGIYENGEDAIRKLGNINERKFILKCNHGSGPKFYSICRNVDLYDAVNEIGKLAEALKQDYSLVALEYFYHYIKPYIFVEELLGENCTDYKFFCFGGVPKYVKVIADRGDRDENGKQIKHQDYYDMDWNFCPLVKDDISMGGGLPCPAGFEYMKKIAEKLSEPFPMARVDLYFENGKVYFGEITLTPAYGMNRTDKPETLKAFGELTDISYWKPEKLLFERTNEIDKFLRQNKIEVLSKRNFEKIENLEIAENKMTSKKYDKETNERMKELGLHLLKNLNLLSESKLEDVQGICTDCCQILGSDGDDVLKSIYMTVLFHIAFREDMSLEECWQIFWNLNRVVFVNSRLRFIETSMINKFSNDRELDLKEIDSSVNHIFLTKLYRIIFDFVSSNMDYSGMPYKKRPERNQNLVILLTSQFLNLGHAPTQRVLDYSYELQHNLGKKVIIVNDGGMHFYRNKHLGGIAAFNFLEELNNISSVEHKGEIFEYLQVAALMPDIQVYQQLLGIIYDLNPLMVFNVGGCSLLADMCNNFTTTASMPCRVDYPITNSEYLLVARSVSTEELEYKNLLSGQKVIETNYNFVYRANDTIYTRSAYGIPEDAFVMVVIGYRIGDEIDKHFLEVLSYCYKEYGQKHNIYIVIVGAVEDERKSYILNYIPVDNRSHMIFTGQLKNASEFIKVSDLYLNPDRNGGGRSSFESLLFGVPVVTLSNGDVSYAVGDEFCVNDYDDYRKTIGRYLENKDFYNSQRKRAVERGKVLENMTETLRRILIDVFDNE